MGSGAEKQTVQVGKLDPASTVGEKVSFTAEIFGKVDFSVDGDHYNSTYYRLPDGTFRVLLEYGNLALLFPSDMVEGMKRGQRNNFTYGRMTLEEIKAAIEFDIAKGYEAIAKEHPETVRNTVRDID